MDRFSKDGRLIIPLNNRGEIKEEKVRYILTEAYCPKGCSIMDEEHQIKGYPGLKIAYKRPGMEGVFVLSAIESDFEKIILSGELKNNVKDDLYCPRCGVMFEKLVNCNCCDNAEMIVIGLTPALDFNNAITFCNVTGCENGAFVKSSTIIRHQRLHAK